MRSVRSIAQLGVALLAMGCASCVTAPPRDAYDAFLAAVKVDCEPIIIGSANMGQAIAYNGATVDAESYWSFLTLTQSLYYGKISPAIYRDSLSTTVGDGAYNDRTFDCIFAHLPSS